LKRLSSVVAALGLASAGLVAASPAAVASGSCSLYVPSKLALTAPERTITVKEGPNCAAAGVVSATWTPHHATAGDGPSVTFANSARSTTFLVEGWYPVGVWTWTPNGAYDAQHVSVYQYSPKTDVRLGSYGRVYPTRSGSKVNVKTLGARYWQEGEKFIGWSYARGQIQYLTPDTTTAHTLKEVYTYSTGTYSYTYSTTAVRDYRVVFYNATNNTIWGSTSPVVRK